MLLNAFQLKKKKTEEACTFEILFLLIILTRVASAFFRNISSIFCATFFTTFAPSISSIRTDFSCSLYF